MVNKHDMENIEKKKTHISAAELAKILGISRIAIFKRIKKGQIPAQKIGRSYAIPVDYVTEILRGKGPATLSDEKKKEITEAVEKVVHEYGETLRLLGKE